MSRQSRRPDRRPRPARAALLLASRRAMKQQRRLPAGQHSSACSDRVNKKTASIGQNDRRSGRRDQQPINIYNIKAGEEGEHACFEKLSL